MLSAFLDSSLTSGLVPIVVYVLGVVSLGFVVVRRPAARSGLLFPVAALAGLGIGFLLAWYLGDVQNDFDVTLTFATRAWFAVGVAGVVVAAVSLWRAHGWRIPVGIAAIVIAAMVGGVGINSTIGEFPTVRSALGLDGVGRLHDPASATRAATPTPTPTAQAKSLPLWSTWHAPAGMPRFGRIGTQYIRPTVSHFVARDAIVYLPPAALVANAPALPVMMFLSGQPASPETVVEAGELPEIMNRFAAAHPGRAPIVVIPDQLGQPQNNPMCVNSPLGQVATYLTVDVRNWILTHLKVQTARADWTIGGFSEGGTCSIQLGTRYRSIFGSIIDISGEVAPLNGSVAHTIAVGFQGSAAAYAAASPLGLLASGAPFSTTCGVFAVGADDAKYRPQIETIEAAASKAGMHTYDVVSPGTAHDWYTERYGLTAGLSSLAARLGLAP